MPSPERHFLQLLSARWDHGTFLCVGLDPDYEQLPAAVKSVAASPADVFFEFNRHIVDATADLVCAFKPNSAFYEALGADGVAALRRTVEYIQSVAPDVPVILDAKRADIGNTNEVYARYAFDYVSADAITVHPYLGRVALQPFLDRSEKGIFVLVQTSNPGAVEFQDLIVDGEKLCVTVARHVAEQWNDNGNCCAVVGAPYPEHLRAIRAVVGDMPILIPGVGAQGGTVEQTVTAGHDSRQRGMIINSSRGVIYASHGSDFTEAARAEALALHREINRCVQLVSAASN